MIEKEDANKIKEILEKTELIRDSEPPAKEFTFKGRHTKLEKRVTKTLKLRNLVTFKPSYPDLLVFNEKSGAFCFVEVKSRYDRPTYWQNRTFKLFRKLGLPVVVVKPDDPFVEEEKFTVGKRFLGTVLKAMRKCEH